MSENTANAYSYFASLKTNAGATAAAIDIITKACAGGGERSKELILDWATHGKNLKDLRDKIKEAAAEE